MASLIRYGAWLLEREPNAVRPLLCEPLQPSYARPLLSGRWLLEPADVYALVRSAAPTSTIGALESMLALAQSAPERRAVVGALVDACILMGTGGDELPPADESAPASAARDRLLALLRDHCADLELGTTLDKLNAATTRRPEHLLRARLLLLGALHRHDEALDLLSISDSTSAPALAYAYCTEHAAGAAEAAAAAAHGVSPASHGAVSGATTSLYLKLLDRYVSPPNGGPPKLSAANDLLTHWPESVPAVEALRRLPPSRPVADFAPGLGALLVTASNRVHHAQIHAALLRAVSVQTRAELLEKRSKRIIVREDAQCIVCGRRIGTAAFVVVRAEKLAHIGCHNH
jgi:hypothetical protein